MRRHVPEVGALQGNAVVRQDAAVPRDVPCCVDVVARHHAHTDASTLAHLDRMGDLSPARQARTVKKLRQRQHRHCADMSALDFALQHTCYVPGKDEAVHRT
jgi:hypothetical protein